MENEDKIIELLGLHQKDISEIKAHLAKIGSLDSGDVLNLARLQALKTLVYELGVHAGISKEDMKKHIQDRIRVCHDVLLSALESKDQATAANLDLRRIDEIPTEKCNPLFPGDV